MNKILKKVLVAVISVIGSIIILVAGVILWGHIYRKNYKYN